MQTILTNDNYNRDKLQEVFDLVNKHEKGKHKVIFYGEDDQKVEENRIRKLYPTYEECIFRLMKGTSTKGWYLDNTEVENLLKRYKKLTFNLDVRVKEDKNEILKKKWIKNVKWAINLLNESKLWPCLKNELEMIYSLGLDLYLQMLKFETFHYIRTKEDYEKYLQEFNSLANCLTDKQKLYFITEEYSNFIKLKVNSFKKSKLYPDMYVNGTNIKKMYFGENNKIILQDIKEALENKKAYTNPMSYTSKYDISFRYDGGCEASYAEEYKGKGNGHYFLALNDTYALYMEED